jgi:hypothetical protein
VAIIEGAGHRVGPEVVECASLAAAAHAQRFEDGRADASAVNRSTFLWALGRADDTVRAALEWNGVRLEALQELLGIRDEQRPLTGPYELAEDLTRALLTFVDAPRKMQLTLTPWSLAVAVLEDVVAHGGLLGDRLRRLGAEPDALLGTLQASPAEGSWHGDGPPLPRMRELTPRRFGVQLPGGQDDPGPYVPRDIDGELDRRLREHLPVVAVVAPVASGAIRTVYEALRRERPGDEVLLLHEWLETRTGADGVGPGDLERMVTSGADVVWVRNLGELLRAHPALETWFREGGELVAATLVLVVRPEDRERAAELGIAPDSLVELTAELTPDERARAEAIYDGDLTRVASLAAASVRRRGASRATYAADSAAAELLDHDHDDLDIRADVDMLARLIASKDVHPPLSIGLFGPWGSGKSFIMRQVKQRIDVLAKSSRAVADEEATGYLRQIVPVEFNAWQYAHGTALWAALINRVFEEIRAKFNDDTQYQKMLRDLADKDHGVAQARERLSTAMAVVEGTSAAAGDRVISDVAKDHAMSEKSTRQINEGLDLDVARQQVSDLKAEVDRLRKAGPRLRKGLSAANAPLKAAAAVLVVAAVVALVLYLFMPGAFRHLIPFATGVLSLIGGATQVLRPVNKGLEQAAKVLRADDADREKLHRAQDELARATDALTAARTSGLAGLYGFVSERSSAAEYRQQLGMAPMIRDDLERLAELSQAAEGIDGIDRIVIYIDDLDRCPASEVVRVLEAVNLLFGFELFVVVVAVDSRWLLRSLDNRFSEAFDKQDSEAPTPQNYLEKIIQIPFWVQPMRPKGFGRLVTSLAGAVELSPDHTQTGGHGVDGELAAGQNWSPSPGGGAGGGGDTDDTVTGALGQVGVAGGAPGPDPSGGDAQAGDALVDEKRGTVPEDDLNPAALRLTSDERDLMMTFLPLVATPRAVKRFLNTYQLLRVSVDDVNLFLARREYAPVLVLLALMTGTVPLTTTMVGQLASMTQADFATFLAELQAKPEAADGQDPSAAWRPVKAACAGLPADTLTPAVIKDWLPRVARYSFHHVGV